MAAFRQERVGHGQFARVAAAAMRPYGCPGATGQHEPETSGDPLPSRRNSIGFLRFALAAMVLISHTYALGGFGYDPLGRFSDRRISLGTLAVYGFFVLSGYLITKSYCTLGQPVRYVWHRALRILPGFWVCLVLTTCVLGTLAYAIDHHSVLPYFQNRIDGPVQYMWANHNLFIANHTIGGVFTHNALPRTFNDSLWTLEVEARCYLAVALIGMLGVLTRARPLLPLLTAALWALAVARPSLPDNLIIPHPSYVPLYLYFALGATLYLYRERLVLRRALFLGSLILALLAFRVGPVPLLLPPALAYALFYLAARLPFVHFDRRMDLSYGLYIYAFPIQQMLALLGLPRLGALPFLAGALLCSLALASLSWRFVEAPSLRMKGWQPSAVVSAHPWLAHWWAGGRGVIPGQVRVRGGRAADAPPAVDRRGEAV